MVQIRKATLEDLPKLLEFEQNIINAERPFDATLAKGSISYYDLKSMIDNPNVEIVVASLNELIVGSGYAKIEVAKPYLDHKVYAYLGFMFTDEDYRGKGINSKIIEALKIWCLKKEIVEIRLDVYDQNEAAVMAYTKSGFKKDMVTMRIRLKK